MKALVMIFLGNDGSAALLTDWDFIHNSSEVLHGIYICFLSHLTVVSRLDLRTWRSEFLGGMLSSL